PRAARHPRSRRRALDRGPARLATSPKCGKPWNLRRRGLFRLIRAIAPPCGEDGAWAGKGELLAIQKNDDSRFRLLIDSVTDYAIYMLDETGRVASWNPGAQRFKGYTEDEILGEHFWRFYIE